MTEIRLVAEINDLFFAISDDVSYLDYRLFQSFADHIVQDGPFKGLQMMPESSWRDGNLCLKLFGYYEHELWNAMERAVLRKPKLIVNIGCCEGYYAVGMALRCPQATVHAVDISSAAVGICTACAELNKVKDRVEVHRLASDFGLEIEPHCLFIIDNEGDEEAVIDGVDDKEDCDFIIECHEHMHEGVTERIVQKLSKTHTIEVIKPMHRKSMILRNDVHYLFEALLLTEKRMRQTRWLACWSHANLGESEALN